MDNSEKMDYVIPQGDSSDAIEFTGFRTRRPNADEMEMLAVYEATTYVNETVDHDDTDETEIMIRINKERLMVLEELKELLMVYDFPHVKFKIFIRTYLGVTTKDLSTNEKQSLNIEVFRYLIREGQGISPLPDDKTYITLE